jgi:hypothetical protein
MVCRKFWSSLKEKISIDWLYTVIIKGEGNGGHNSTLTELFKCQIVKRSEEAENPQLYVCEIYQLCGL